MDVVNFGRNVNQTKAPTSKFHKPGLFSGVTAPPLNEMDMVRH